MSERRLGSRLESAFLRAQEEGRTALVLYLTVGYPDLETTVELVPRLVAAGADVVELGVPFSDPLADGITIQKTSAHALEQGVRLQDCLEAARRIRECTAAPLLFMGYYNPILQFGHERYAEACAEAGVDGTIVPDLPPEEARELHDALSRRGQDLVFLLAPTSPDARIAQVAAVASGFVYCVSLTGVTGARTGLPPALGEFLGRVRRRIALPLAVGFGIATPDHVRQVGAVADGAIVGSALLDVLGRHGGAAGLAEAEGYVRSLAAAARKGSAWGSR